ncbi:MAG: ABC transporter permease [Alphaproteobacteria bacterium]|nr:ABC transporter permease [Alphaproteobacteria bacterium]
MTWRDRLADPALGSLPLLAGLALWLILPQAVEYPSYMLPPLGQVAARIAESVADLSLPGHVLASLERLAFGFVIGNGLAIPLGIAIALNRHASDLLRPLLTFLQSIAGIAWVPLAIIWFGIGKGAVVFVIANTIFFASIYNTVAGVQAIPNSLHRAVRCHGGRGLQVFTELILPGALVQIILGLRTSMAYGWRALVAGEMIAGTSGLGYMTIEAVQWYKTETIIMGMIVIGCLWLMLDRILFVPLERVTVRRWGLIQR